MNQITAGEIKKS